MCKVTDGKVVCAPFRPSSFLSQINFTLAGPNQATIIETELSQARLKMTDSSFESEMWDIMNPNFGKLKTPNPMNMSTMQLWLETYFSALSIAEMIFYYISTNKKLVQDTFDTTKPNQ